MAARAGTSVKRKKLTPAEREARSEISFARDRPARDAKLREHLAATAGALDKSALIAASHHARERAMRLRLVDMNARRKDRIKRRRDLMDEYRAWISQAPAWLWSD